MPLLDEPTVSSPADAPADARPATDDPDIDLTGQVSGATHAPALAHPDHTSPARRRDRPDRRPGAGEGPLVDPSGRLPRRGMRIRRLRLGSVALVAAVFWSLGFLVVLGTAIAVWHVAQSFGFVTEVEDVLVTSLGLDSLEIDGAGLLWVVSIGAAAISVIGWLVTVLLAAVYNATCGLFGGLAVETGPLQRHHRVFSWRHRGFVTIRA